jgi:crotonobetainyl-CoA:carnitine CoA-transferase CaiB-like acyl-CoA transferase
MDTEGALSGIRVLDLTRIMAGPLGTMILADMGADIIKIERPGVGDDTRQMGPFQNGASMYYITHNRNKKGITLNLKVPEGKRLFLEMVKKADVVVENYRADTMDKLGLGYDVLKDVNPRIIYACVSGFGHYGRYKDRAGYDIIAEAMSGMMYTTGWPDSGPTRCGIAMGDVLAGLWMTIGVMGALEARNRTGKGQKVDVALVDASVSAMATASMFYLSKGTIPQRCGNRSSTLYPFDSFACSDGDCVISASSNKLWKILCALIGRPELAEDERYGRVRDRVEHHDEVKQIIEVWSRTKTVTDVVAACEDAGIPVSPINDIGQVCRDPHIAIDREMMVQQHHPVAGDVTVTGSPLKFSDTPVQIKTVAPLLGQDTEQVLRDVLGLDADQVAKLKEDKII